ncbi:MAG: hypothetical protein WD397_04310 [Wenzhouxiangellaceae bacterium]
MISEILLMGLAVVVIYLIAHKLTMAIDRRWAGALGAWRSAVFFVVFLALLLLASALVRGS